jgi:hypothetical protein
MDVNACVRDLNEYLVSTGFGRSTSRTSQHPDPPSTPTPLYRCRTDRIPRLCSWAHGPGPVVHAILVGDNRRIDEPDLVDDGFALTMMVQVHMACRCGPEIRPPWPCGHIDANLTIGQCCLITVVGFLSHASPVIALMDGTSIMPTESQVKSA